MGNEIFYSLPANKLLALAAYGEAASEGTEGLMAVVNVIRNRTKEPSKFANQVILNTTNSIWHAVILKPCQFSSFNDGSSSYCPKADPVRAKLVTLMNTWDNAIQSNSVLNTAYQVSNMVFNNTLADNTAGATFYHAAYVSPTWASTIPFIGQIGQHLFYGYKTVTETVTKFVKDYTPHIVIGIICITTLLILNKEKMFKGI